EAGGPRKRGDAAGDQRLEGHVQTLPAARTEAGGRGAASIAGPQPGGSASRSASAARSNPAPRPRASAIRAFGPDRWPASRAPARTHVAPPPGKAYAAPAAPAAQRDVKATTI